MGSEVVLANAARSVLSIACFRGAPMVVWATLAPGASARVRVTACFLGVLMVAFMLRGTSLPLGWITVAYAYFAVLGLGARSLSAALRARRITAGAAFAMSLSGFVVAPGLVVPTGPKAFALVLGWELTLSAYSYCVEAAKAERPSSIPDCLFFLLVNPALVYTDRGKRFGDIAWSAAGLRRSVVGLCALLIAVGVLTGFATGERAATIAYTAGMFAGIGALRPIGFLTQYLEHSGLAAVQIGFIYHLGYAVPERYNRPLLSSGPDDFWRRWNTYVGGWMQRYVYWPTTLRMARSGSPLERRVAQIVGVLLTFACVGALHDVSGYLIGFSTVGQSALVFSASGILVLAWVGASKAWRVAVPNAAEWGWAQLGSAILSRILFWWSAFALFYAWTK